MSPYICDIHQKRAHLFLAPFDRRLVLLQPRACEYEGDYEGDYLLKVFV